MYELRVSNPRAVPARVRVVRPILQLSPVSCSWSVTSRRCSSRNRTLYR